MLCLDINVFGLYSLRLKFTNEPSIFVDGGLDESIKRSASDRLGDLVPQVRARTFPGVFHDMALLGLCLELSFNYSTVVPRPTLLLLLFLFSSSGNCLKNVATDFFIPFQRLVAMKQSQGILKNTCFVRFEIFRKVNLRTLKFCGNFCR